MGLFDFFTGAGDAKKAGNKAAKAYKKAETTRRSQLSDANTLYQAQVPEITAARDKALGAITAGGASSQNALKAALKGQTDALAADDTRQTALYDPYIDYGQGAIPLMEGAYGESPEASADFMQRYENSPLYQAQYLASQELAGRGLDRAAAARGGLNNGGTIREAMREGNLLGRKNIMDYYGLLGDRMGIGMNATNALSGAYGRNTGLRTSAYGNYGDASSSAYQNTASNQANTYGNSVNSLLNAGNTLSANRNTAYGGISDAQVGKGAAKASGLMGAANNTAGFWNGAMNLGGNLLGGAMGWNPLPTFKG